MKRYVCTVCGYIYVPENGDPDGGIAPGTPFEKLPAGWVCPMCGAGKEAFAEEQPDHRGSFAHLLSRKNRGV